MTRSRMRRYFRHGFLPQIVAFEACVRHGSVTRAAEELSLAQPTVSCLVRKLSETLGLRVLETRSRRVEPTIAGRELLGLCEEIFAAFHRFDERRAAIAESVPAERSPQEFMARSVARFVPMPLDVCLARDLPELPAKVSSRR